MAYFGPVGFGGHFLKPWGQITNLNSAFKLIGREMEIKEVTGLDNTDLLTSSPVCFYKTSTFSVSLWSSGTKLKFVALELTKEVHSLGGIIVHTDKPPWLHSRYCRAKNRAKCWA